MNRMPLVGTLRVAAAVLAMMLSSQANPAAAPRSVTMSEPVALALLRLAKAGPEDRVVAVGPGDGSGFTAAAKSLGARTARMAPGPEDADLPSATVVVLYLAPEAALELRPLLLIGRPGTRVVSLGTDLGDWKPDRAIAVHLPAFGNAPARKGNAYLWIVPANLNGNWCGQDAAIGAVLRISQRLQVVEGAFLKATKALNFDGKIEGTRIAAAAGRLALEQSGDVMRVTTAQGNYASYRNASFARNCCGTCPVRLWLSSRP